MATKQAQETAKQAKTIHRFIPWEWNPELQKKVDDLSKTKEWQRTEKELREELGEN